MTSKILLRRGTAAQWTSANPILGTGELGIETDTLKIKVGNGSSTWTQLTNYINVTPSGLSNSLGDYILLANQGNAGGPAELDSNGDLLIPENSAIFWNDPAYSYTTTLTTTQPTANRVITFPNATGTVALTSDITSAVTNLINAAPSTLDTLNELAAAINNDSSFSTTVNNLLSGKVSKSGGDIITAATASTVGLVIKGASSQTANLQQWKDSNNNNVAIIQIDGNIKGNYFDNVASTGSYLQTSNTNGFSIINRDAAHISLRIVGAASQTANLQEWKNSAGTILSKVDFSGKIFANGLRLDGSDSSDNSIYKSGNINILAGNAIGLKLNQDNTATGGPVIIRPAYSQTANLTEWQNSSGTVLLSISSDGVINKTGTTYIGSQLWFANPGIGNETKFNFAKTSDSAYLSVKERSSDQTYYEFGMWDNALDGGDYFQWHMGQWSGGTGYTWMPLQLGANASLDGYKAQTLKFTGEQSVFWSPILTGSNTPYYTTNPNYQTHQDFEVTKGWAYTSNSTNIPRVNASGGATLNIDLSGYTYASRMGYRLTVDAGGTTFSYTTYGGDNSSGSAIAITGGWQTLSNGTKIKINGTAAANDDWQFLAFPTPRVTFGGTTDTTSLVTIKPSASDKGLVIRAAASPTTNIQEWQDSSGAAKVNINNSFNATFNNGAGVYGNYGNVAALVVGTTATTLPAIVAQAALNQTADIQQWQNNSGTVLTRISSSGRLGINIGSNPSSMIHVVTDGTASTGLILRGQSGQTGNLQEWHDGSGNALALVNSSGAIITGGIVRATNGGIFGGTAQLSTALTVYAQTPGQIGQIIRAAASQSANLQEWQDSSGTVLAFVNQVGTARFYMLDNLGLVSIGTSTTGSASLNIDTNITTRSGIIIKGVASQTANLQEWQNSSGTALSYIKSNGSFYVVGNSNTTWISGPSTSGTNQIVSNGNDLAFSPFFDGLFAPANSSGRWRPVNDATSDLGTSGQRWKDLYATASVLTNNSASKVGLIVKGAASQTANLQEWQNNNGDVLAYVESGGHFGVGNLYSSFGGSATKLGYVTISGSLPAIKPLVIRGATSQTANLQEWQNNSGTVLSKVDASGNIFVGTNQVLTKEDEKNIYITDSGTARTLGSSDAYKILEFTSSSSITVTIPNDASDTTFPIGSYVEVRQMGGGQITVSATSPATLVATDNQYKTRVQYSAIVLEKRASNAWYLAGDTTA